MSYNRLSRIMSGRVLKFSKDRNYAASLHKLFQCLITLKGFFFVFKMEFNMF